MSQTGDSLIVAAPEAIRTVVASAGVTRIDVSRGRSRMQGAIRGMKVGTTIVGGGLAIIFTTAYIAEGGTGDSIAELLAYTAYGAAAGAMYGAGVGALLGAETWSTVYSAPHRVSFGPSRSGPIGVGVSIRF
jgi:hypothetical protein